MKVCLIEDDLLLGRALVASMEQAGHEVLWLRLLRDAEIWLSDSDGFDAVVLDLGLPDGEGIVLLRALRKQEAVPVIIITARDTLSERLDGLDAGADDYLVKPFDNAELLARLRAVLRRGSRFSESTSVLTVGDISLDESSMRVQCAGEPVALSPTEYTLLRELLRYKNRVRTRRQLEAQALPESEGAALDVHISNLRKKIGASLIRTVRGVGYVIDEEQSATGNK